MGEDTPGKGFWALAVLLLIWNLMGLMAFGYDGLITPEAIAKLPEAQQPLYNDRPVWVVVAFGLAVTAGTAACVALLLRRRLALGLFATSLVAVLVQDSWYFFGGVIDVMGATAVIMPALVIGSLVGGIVLTRRAGGRGWLVQGRRSARR